MYIFLHIVFYNAIFEIFIVVQTGSALSTGSITFAIKAVYRENGMQGWVWFFSLGTLSGFW